MKNLCVLTLVFLGGQTLSGCSGDGIYTPPEPADDAGPEPDVACEFKDESLCDGGPPDAAKP